MARRMAARACARAACPRIFVPARAVQRFCSRKCGATAHRNRAACGRAGGKASAVGRLNRAVAEVAAVCPGLSLDAKRAVLAMARRSWLAGWRSGQRAGYRRGWAEACGDSKERAA